MNYYQPHLSPIPAGQIELRDDRKKQTWTVEIKPFLLARFLVTQELYQAITQQNPSTFKRPQKPVETVSWVEAVQFCNALSTQNNLQPCYEIPANPEKITSNPQANGYRLPTEAEWEYVCKAGTSGSRYGELNEIAWFKVNSGGGTHEVGQKQPNAWGLYDMLGNVWEWTADVYLPDGYSRHARDNPRVESGSDRHVLRGGSFKSDITQARCGARAYGVPQDRLYSVGLRIVRQATSQ